MKPNKVSYPSIVHLRVLMDLYQIMYKLPLFGIEKPPKTVLWDIKRQLRKDAYIPQNPKYLLDCLLGHPREGYEEDTVPMGILNRITFKVASYFHIPITMNASSHWEVFLETFVVLTQEPIPNVNYFSMLDDSWKNQVNVHVEEIVLSIAKGHPRWYDEPKLATPSFKKRSYHKRKTKKEVVPEVDRVTEIVEQIIPPIKPVTYDFPILFFSAYFSAVGDIPVRRAIICIKLRDYAKLEYFTHEGKNVVSQGVQTADLSGWTPCPRGNGFVVYMTFFTESMYKKKTPVISLGLLIYDDEKLETMHYVKGTYMGKVAANGVLGTGLIVLEKKDSYQEALNEQLPQSIPDKITVELEEEGVSLENHFFLGEDLKSTKRFWIISQLAGKYLVGFFIKPPAGEKISSIALKLCEIKTDGTVIVYSKEKTIIQQGVIKKLYPNRTVKVVFSDDPEEPTYYYSCLLQMEGSQLKSITGNYGGVLHGNPISGEIYLQKVGNPKDFSFSKVVSLNEEYDQYHPTEQLVIKKLLHLV